MILHVPHSLSLSEALLSAPPPPPLSALSTIALVTASDMIPFVPCQPLAMTLGATIGIWAFPICVIGQTCAGILAFSSARAASNAPQVEHVVSRLPEKARIKFEEFKRIGSTESENVVLLGLIGLRLAPFFPFSAGNYLLGGGTSVALQPFFLATLLGCLLSNFISVSVGIGGNELLQQTQQHMSI